MSGALSRSFSLRPVPAIKDTKSRVDAITSLTRQIAVNFPTEALKARPAELPPAAGRTADA